MVMLMEEMQLYISLVFVFWEENERDSDTFKYVCGQEELIFILSLGGRFYN